MSLDQFVRKWLGGRTDYDHVYAYQCVDLILQYLADCYGITSGVWGNAIDYWTKPTARLLQDFEKVTGPQRGGDIVILNPTKTNPYGHIMIAINGTTCIEQNGYSGDGDGLNGDEVRYRATPTDRVAGILRPKKGNDDVITQNDLGPVRIVMSEVEGWNGHEIHSGKYDAQIMGAWVGHTWTEFLQHCWEVQPTHRVHLEDFISTQNSQIASLNQRPTQDTVNKLNDQVAETTSKLDTVLSQSKDKDAKIAELQAQVALKSEDTEQLNKLGEFFKWALKRFGLSK